MLFLFGLRSKAKVIGQLERTCSKCAKPTVQSAIETQRWFTVFFIPLIPIGGSYAIRCNLCGLTVKGSPEIKKQLAAPKAMAAGA
ncbi:MAG: zinc-ribbon domain-containing protein [Acidobacteria bacterium]|jgi:zinc-ribbon family|nr:MAG: zinc-ribbon domain-containing protein [Acidobacteriota bacterium]PYV91039.1 MAG: zinc-ribbon domain-containing protein [Acidobacteriota bacterium]